MVKWVNLKTKFHKVFHGFRGEIAKLDFGLPMSTLKEIHVNEGKELQHGPKFPCRNSKRETAQ